jgi:hypothetical protein
MLLSMKCVTIVVDPMGWHKRQMPRRCSACGPRSVSA